MCIQMVCKENIAYDWFPDNLVSTSYFRDWWKQIWKMIGRDPAFIFSPIPVLYLCKTTFGMQDLFLELDTILFLSWFLFQIDTKLCIHNWPQTESWCGCKKLCSISVLIKATIIKLATFPLEQAGNSIARVQLQLHGG